MAWLVVFDDARVPHVVPKDDLREHEASGLDCWCRPSVDAETDRVVIHNPADGRRAKEAN